MGTLDYVVHRTSANLRACKQALMAGNVPHWIRHTGRARYVTQVILSTPPWVDRAELKLIQLRCRQLTELSGEPYHVSHVIPLNHPRMCGLTVPWNLEAKPARINLRESNHVQLDDQLELFP